MSDTDFVLIDHGSIVILDPVTDAALEWCYEHLPEDAPRWGRVGYAIELRYIHEIADAAVRDGLTV